MATRTRAFMDGPANLSKRVLRFDDGVANPEDVLAGFGAA